ncbi:CD4-2 molecule, tandem duplicate 2 [Acanthopagrus latus]|uniref:CD4-2 molecule, tandem duplicate 2 n=1 Tax=Acanthopagrus latus TaxID=8177 RepID=UPI00187CB93B|nr:CD4-2 molecule, tandem duplicate 2 [Acanthopagrus latus]
MKTVVWFGFVLGALSAAGTVIVTRTGETATLPCQSFTKTLEWLRESEIVIADGKFSRKGQTDLGRRSAVKQSNLVISNVKPADAGSFTCMADGRIQQKALVVVSVSADPSVELHPGSKVTLQCEVNGLSPSSTIQWQRPDGSSLAGPSQTVEPVALSDAGTWACTFTYGGQTYTQNLPIKVKEPVTTTTPPLVSSKNSKNDPKNPETPSTSDLPNAAGQLLGLSWWMWVVIGVGCLVVVLLMVLVIVLCKRIKRRKRKLQMMKDGRQLLTPRQYCQCNCPAAAAKPQQGRRREKPSVPPLQPLLME